MTIARGRILMEAGVAITEAGRGTFLVAALSQDALPRGEVPHGFDAVRSADLMAVSAKTSHS
jgi:hypothetical protein